MMVRGIARDLHSIAIASAGTRECPTGPPREHMATRAVCQADSVGIATESWWRHLIGDHES